MGKKRKQKSKPKTWSIALSSDSEGRALLVTEEVQADLARLWFASEGRTELNGFGLVHTEGQTLTWYKLFLFSGESSSGGVTSDPEVMGKIITDVALGGGNVAELRLFWHFHPASLGPFWSTTDDKACEKEVAWTKSEVINVVCTGIDALARIDRPFRPDEEPRTIITHARTGHYDKGTKKYTWEVKEITQKQQVHSCSIPIHLPEEETDEYNRIQAARAAGIPVQRALAALSHRSGAWAPWQPYSLPALSDGRGLPESAQPADDANALWEWDVDAAGWPTSCPTCGASGQVYPDEYAGDLWLCSACETIIAADGSILKSAAKHTAPDTADLTQCPVCGSALYDAEAGFCWACYHTG